MSVPKMSGRLGTRLRGKLAEAYGQRGHQTAGLWYVYSPRTEKDWVLRGDLNFEHFVLTEADTSVRDVEYSPSIQIANTGHTKVAAIVRYSDGSEQWHSVTANDAEPTGSTKLHRQQLIDAAQRADAELIVVTPNALHQNMQKLWNWQRAITWISAARSTALSPYMTEIAAHVYRRDCVSLGEIAELGASELFPLYAAAAFRLVQRGELDSDLDDLPLSMRTEFTMRGAQ